MEIITRIIADGLFVPLAAMAVYTLAMNVPHPKKFLIYSRLIMAGLTSYVTAKIIALFYQPSHMRPFESMGVDPGAAYLNNPGFPSDHALLAMFLVIAVWYATRDKTLTFVMLGLAVLIGVGRIIALVHTPLDVIGGFMLAFVGVIWLGKDFINFGGKKYK